MLILLGIHETELIHTIGWSLIFGLFFVAALIGIVQLYNRVFRDSDKHRRTVPAIFLYQTLNRGMIRLQDRSRLANHNTQQVMIENRLLVFQDEETGKQIKFSVSGDFGERWKEEQKGLLTYSGKRFITFRIG